MKDVTKLGEVINKDSSPPIALVDETSFDLSNEAMLGRDNLVSETHSPGLVAF